MNCDEVKSQIDQKIFEAGIELESDAERHLNQCSDCTDYYEAAFEEESLIRKIQQSQPTPGNAEELTNSIISAIMIEDQKDAPAQKQSEKIINMAVRLLAAASVVLFISFSFEQYQVLQKMEAMEVSAKNVRQYSTADPTIINLQTLSSVKLTEMFQQVQPEEINKEGVFNLLLASKLTAYELIQLNKLKSLIHDNRSKSLKLFNRSN